MDDKGHVDSQEYAEAVKRYREAAEQGNARVRTTLG